MRLSAEEYHNVSSYHQWRVTIGNPLLLKFSWYIWRSMCKRTYAKADTIARIRAWARYGVM